jgi:hypothetical protein
MKWLQTKMLSTWFINHSTWITKIQLKVNLFAINTFSNGFVNMVFHCNKFISIMIFDLVYKIIFHLTNPVVNGIILTIIWITCDIFL